MVFQAGLTDSSANVATGERTLFGVRQVRGLVRQTAGERIVDGRGLGVQGLAAASTRAGYGQASRASGVMYVPGSIMTSCCTPSPLAGPRRRTDQRP